jgi:hypothetical protein
MKASKIKIFLAACFALGLMALCVQSSYAGRNTSFSCEAGPMLFYPVTENIDLAGKGYLEFRWWRVELVWTDHFIFKLYKGYNTTGDNLIFKQDYSGWDYPVKLPASQFEVGQVYTWVLQQVFKGGKKSDRSSSSFKIIKK